MFEYKMILKVDLWLINWTCLINRELIINEYNW